MSRELPPLLPDPPPVLPPPAPHGKRPADPRPAASPREGEQDPAFDFGGDPPPIPPGSQWSDAVDAGSPRNRTFWRWVLLAGAGCFAVVLTSGLLLLTYLPRLVERWTSGSRFAVESDLRRILEAVESHAARHAGRYPEALEELTRPDRDGRVGLEAVPRDPWERAYRYAGPSAAHPRPRVWTLGADDRPGGTGEDADLGSDELRLGR